MKTVYVVMITALAVGIASVVPASGQDEGTVPPPPSGMLRTMPHGDYLCALPGDAGGAAFRVIDGENFRISTQSRYTSAQGEGTYILRGERLTFTRGPKKGERFERVGDNQLRKLNDAGARSALLCTRRTDDR